jgi:hypothetical protein
VPILGRRILSANARLKQSVWSILASLTMRTFPKALSTFRDIVNERGARLRKLPFEELARRGESPIEHLSVASRPATISVIVQSLPSGGIRVVVQGFMKARLFGQNVALDGFYKYPDGIVAPMPKEDLYEFD